MLSIFTAHLQAQRVLELFESPGSVHLGPQSEPTDMPHGGIFGLKLGRKGAGKAKEGSGQICDS